MFSDALTYPKDSTNAVSTVLIGGVLTLLSVLLVPIALVTGYAVRVARSVHDGDDQLPGFDAWGELFVDGLKGVAIMVVYFIIPAVILTAVVAIGALLGAGRLGAVVTFLGALLALPIWLIAWYAATAGFLNFAVTGRLGAAFEFDALRPILLSGTFATAWLTGLAVLVLASIVSGILGVIPIVGLLSAFVVFYATIAATYCYARGFAASTPVRSVPETPDADPAI